MKREIYEVYAKIVDANGAYNTLSGYPKAFDSHTYGDDVDKARKRVYGEFHETIGALAKRDDRQQQIVMIIRASDGLQIEKWNDGKVNDLPDPKYAVTVINGSGSGEYEEGYAVSISADAPEEGKQFAAWEGAEGLTFVSGNASSAYASFRMPAEAVTLTATYEDAPEPEPEPEPEPQPEGE